MPSRREMVLAFDVHAHFRLEVVREGRDWVTYRVADGRRRRLADVVIPAELPADAIGGYLDDLFHELAQPGTSVTGGVPPGRSRRPQERSRRPRPANRVAWGRARPATGEAS